VFEDGKMVKVEQPDDMRLSTFVDQFLFQPRSDWTIGEIDSAQSCLWP
jgi:hypothetical protein